MIALIMLVATFAALAFLLGTVAARSLVNRVQDRPVRCGREGPSLESSARRVLEFARSVSINARAIDDDIKGVTHG